MALSSNQKATITAIIEGYIADIPVTKLSDFQALTDGLRLIADTDTVVVTAPMQNAFNMITDYMSNEMFSFEGVDEGSEFLSLCKSVIAEREQYFSVLSDAEKEAYICRQSGEGQLTAAHQSHAEATQNFDVADVVGNLFMSGYEQLDAFLLGAIACGQALDRGDTSCLVRVMNFGFGGILEPWDSSSSSDTASSIRYGHWEKGLDNWESGAMENRDISGAIYRQRNYALNCSEVIKNLYFYEYNSGEVQFAVTVLSSNDRDSDVLDSERCIRFQGALNQAGMHEDLSHVVFFPKPENGVLEYTPNVYNFVIRGTAEEIMPFVYPIFGAIESLEGEGSLPFEMREEIRASIESMMVSREAFEEKSGL